jgi:hypothetical protein
MYKIDPDFAAIIGLKNHESISRKDFQNAFIGFAINKGIIDMETRCYNVAKIEFIAKRLNCTAIQPRELFKYLQPVMTPLS